MRKDGHELTEAALKRFLEVRIVVHKVPEAIRFLSDLPKGPTGKVARQTLRQWSAGAPPVQGTGRENNYGSNLRWRSASIRGNESPDPGTQSNRSKT